MFLRSLGEICCISFRIVVIDFVMVVSEFLQAFRICYRCPSKIVQDSQNKSFVTLIVTEVKERKKTTTFSFHHWILVVLFAVHRQKSNTTKCLLHFLATVREHLIVRIIRHSQIFFIVLFDFFFLLSFWLCCFRTLSFCWTTFWYCCCRVFSKNHNSVFEEILYLFRCASIANCVCRNFWNHINHDRKESLSLDC